MKSSSSDSSQPLCCLETGTGWLRLLLICKATQFRFATSRLYPFREMYGILLFIQYLYISINYYLLSVFLRA
jgi:hypothetical protein